MYSSDSFLSDLGTGIIMMPLLICLVFAVITIVANWKLFEKMGLEGWKSIIPFYNSYCQCEKLLGNGLYFLIAFAGVVPCIGAIIAFLFQVVLCIRLAKAFGKDSGFILGLIFLYPIFAKILAFGDATYSQLPEWDYHNPFE